LKKRIIHPGSYKTLFTRYIFSQLQESEEKKEGEEEDGEKKDDTIVYADLDKSAMSEGTRPSVTVENELSEYAEIKPQTKE